VYTAIGIFCAFYVGWLLANYARNIPTVVYTVPPDDEQKCSKHVEAISRSRLKASSASCWSYCTVKKLYLHLQ
jgi:hypothetical protein